MLLHSEFLRFLIAGSLNTIISYIVYLLLLYYLPYLLAYSMAYAIGLLFSFYLNAKFVFKVPVTFKKILFYPSIYLVQYLLGLLILYITVNFFQISEKLSLLISIFITIPITFILNRIIMHYD